MALSLLGDNTGLSSIFNPFSDPFFSNLVPANLMSPDDAQLLRRAIPIDIRGGYPRLSSWLRVTAWHAATAARLSHNSSKPVPATEAY